MKVITILFLILILICLYYFIGDLEYFKQIEGVPEKMYYTINSCKYITPENIKKVFEDNHIMPLKNTNTDKPIIYLPCTYDDIEKEIKNMNLKKDQENRVFIIHNADQIVGKDGLWKNLNAYYGYEKALTMAPNTYVLYEENDVRRLMEDFDSNQIYILKKNIQRQEGLKLSNNYDEIINNKAGYVLAQELLQDPYLIKGRKINLRVYVLVVCHKNKYQVYAYKDGFMYYTKDLFKKNSLEMGPNITTGYVDRWIYDVHPLTHEDFRNYLDKERPLSDAEKQVKTNISEYVFNNIYGLVKNVFRAFYEKIGNGEKLHDQLSFQLFGIDVAIDEYLNAKIMEVNKGPDLGSKDDRDGNLKRGLIKDILKIVKAVEDDSSNKFLKVLEVEN
jgi:hypothetical protein